MIIGVLCVLAAIIVLFFILAMVTVTREEKAKAARLAAMSPEDREQHLAAEALIKNMLQREKLQKANSKISANKPETSDSPKANSDEASNGSLGSWFLYGNPNTAMICPHCNAKGFVRTRRLSKKKGISGSKATAAIVTGGYSLLATGLSRKERVTDAHCSNCNNKWSF